MENNHNLVVNYHKKLSSVLFHSQVWELGGKQNLPNPNCGSASADDYQESSVRSPTDSDGQTILD